MLSYAGMAAFLKVCARTIRPRCHAWYLQVEDGWLRVQAHQQAELQRREHELLQKDRQHAEESAAAAEVMAELDQYQVCTQLPKHLS